VFDEEWSGTYYEVKNSHASMPQPMCHQYIEDSKKYSLRKWNKIRNGRKWYLQRKEGAEYFIYYDGSPKSKCWKLCTPYKVNEVVYRTMPDSIKKTQNKSKKCKSPVDRHLTWQVFPNAKLTEQQMNIRFNIIMQHEGTSRRRLINRLVKYQQDA
jgi:hypothetical protein